MPKYKRRPIKELRKLTDNLYLDQENNVIVTRLAYENLDPSSQHLYDFYVMQEKYIPEIRSKQHRTYKKKDATDTTPQWNKLKEQWFISYIENNTDDPQAALTEWKKQKETSFQTAKSWFRKNIYKG